MKSGTWALLAEECRSEVEVDLARLWKKEEEVGEVSDRAEGGWLYLPLKLHSRSTVAPLRVFFHFSGTGARHAMA